MTRYRFPIAVGETGAVYGPGALNHGDGIPPKSERELRSDAVFQIDRRGVRHTVHWVTVDLPDYAPEPSFVGEVESEGPDVFKAMGLPEVKFPEVKLVDGDPR